MIRLFKRKTEAERKKEAIDRLRLELRSWGYDISDLSDENIEDGMKHISNAFLSVGRSLSEVEVAFKEIIIATRNAQIPAPQAKKP